MDILKQDDLRQLIEFSSNEYCVSLYLPTHQAGREQQQDPIRLKNLIAKAQERLIEYGVRMPEIQEITRAAEDLLTNKKFWQHQSKGLAVFLSTGFFRTYRLLYRFVELLAIAKNFHIKPLIPLLNQDGQFYILAISLNEVRLFLGTRDTIDELDLPGIPTNMQEALLMDAPEKQLGFHTGTKNPSTSGNRPAVFHGQAGPSDEAEKKRILRYFQIINGGLNKVIEDKTIPMVLAGVDYLLPIYNEANTYSRLLKDGLEGNPQELNAKELQKRAWELVAPIFNISQKQATRQFEQLHGKQSELATNDLNTAVMAASHGRVDTLIVPLGVQHWGRFEPQDNKIVLDTHPGPKNMDLLDFAATQTILTSGRVYAVEPEELPGSGDLAAILRYTS